MTDDDNPYVRDLSRIKLADLTVDDAAYCHLSRRGWEPISGHVLYTTLDSIEAEMRQSRGTRVTANYLPLLAAFSILEQLGDTYRNLKIDKHPNRGAGVEHALYYFCGYSPMSEEVKALYALRNGLMHAASLTSTDQGTNARYIFRYDYSMKRSIQLSEKPWDGQFSTISPAVITIVNPRHFTDQVSHAITNVRELFFRDRQNLKIRKTKGAILASHLIWVQPR